MDTMTYSRRDMDTMTYPRRVVVNNFLSVTYARKGSIKLSQKSIRSLQHPIHCMALLGLVFPIQI